MWIARSILVEIKELENSQRSIASVEPTASLRFSTLNSQFSILNLLDVNFWR